VPSKYVTLPVSVNSLSAVTSYRAGRLTPQPVKKSSVVQEQLRHVDIQTTTGYTRLTQQDVRTSGKLVSYFSLSSFPNTATLSEQCRALGKSQSMGAEIT